MIHVHLILAMAPLEVFARAGGGGSSGGSGGGGGGGDLIALVGYVPAHYTSSWFTKHVSITAGYISGIIVGIAATVGTSFLSAFMASLIAVAAGIGVYSGTHNWLTRLGDKVKSSKKALEFSASVDPAWQEERLRERIREVFDRYQDDWTRFDLESIKTYTTARYFGHIRLMLAAMQQMGRQNIVDSPLLKSADIIDPVDVRDNEKDRFTVYAQARANDMLIERTDHGEEQLYYDGSSFEEFWRFDREGDQWMLDGIDQATADGYSGNPSLRSFALANGMYYSLDWGWLLLPQRGQLFSRASFKGSDINNHVIGQWQDLIVQLYTYNPDKNTRQADVYLIGQITLPKTYGGILIRRRDSENFGGWLTMAPKGYMKIETEWPDFNQRYHLYATDMDKVTTFELLNPAVMAWLYDQDIKVNIEVVDNVVYLYSKLIGAETRYASMLSILQRSFEELKR